MSEKLEVTEVFEELRSRSVFDPLVEFVSGDDI